MLATILEPGSGENDSGEESSDDEDLSGTCHWVSTPSSDEKEESEGEEEQQLLSDFESSQEEEESTYHSSEIELDVQGIELENLYREEESEEDEEREQSLLHSEITKKKREGFVRRNPGITRLQSEILLEILETSSDEDDYKEDNSSDEEEAETPASSHCVNHSDIKEQESKEADSDKEETSLNTLKRKNEVGEGSSEDNFKKILKNLEKEHPGFVKYARHHEEEAEDLLAFDTSNSEGESEEGSENNEKKETAEIEKWFQEAT